jgi:sec-independent protein translocase protein TatC
VSLKGIVEVFRGKPRHPMGADGRMALSDHFRELRSRLIKSFVAIVIAMGFGLYFYNQLFELIYRPYEQASLKLAGEVVTRGVIQGQAAGLLLNLKMAGAAGLILSSPVWLYQLWAFILPGLHQQERRWTRIFVLVAGPLFLAGVAVGYYVLPKGLEVLIGFTPKQLENLVDFGAYFGFFTRMLLVFGISFEIPVFVIMLNLAGVVSGKTLGRYRSWIILATFVFAAVATPSTDPFSMLMLALPMLVLFLLAEIVARTVDKMRGRGLESTANWDDDQVSPL